METIILGRGEIGMSVSPAPTDTVSIFFEELPKALSIGQSYKKSGKKLVEIQFENIEGLNVLLLQLHRCKTVLEFWENIPLELRFGA